jgi:PAS domain-containing protein
VVTDIVDLSHERQLSLRLKESDGLFNVFMKHTPNLAWMVNDEAQLVFASRSFYKYFGLNEQQAIREKDDGPCPTEVANALYEKHVSVLETGLPAELVKKVKWPDGTNFVFHINIFPVENIGGKECWAAMP